METKTFKEWLLLKELAPNNNAVLGGRLAQQSAVGKNFQARSAQPMARVNDKNRLPLLAQFIIGVYNKLPPERRLDVFTREFATLKQKIVSSMATAQSQQQQQVNPQQVNQQI